MSARVAKSALLAFLPPEWPEDLMPAIREAVTSSRRKVVVLDNDPTGTQTVHEIPVLTDWSVESLCGKQGVGGEVDLERAVRRPPGPAAEPDQTELRTFTIITTAPNPVVGAYHDRMPVILPRNDHERWLDPAFADAAELQKMLRPFTEKEMRVYLVGSVVNDSSNDNPQWVEPVGGQ